jgi:hypothetical protein
MDRWIGDQVERHRPMTMLPDSQAGTSVKQQYLGTMECNAVFRTTPAAGLHPIFGITTSNSL